MNQCTKCHGLGYYDEGHENDDGSMSGGNYVNCEVCNGDKAMRQCKSCGGFCNKSGCERENVPIITSSDVIASLQMALSQAEAMIERQQHVMQRAMEAWDSTTHQKNGDGRLWQCMEELRAESHNAEVSGLSTRPPGYRADFDGEK